MSKDYSDKVNHVEGCTGLVRRQQMRLGDWCYRCKDCKRFRIIPPDETAGTPATTTTRYVCREHEHRAVNHLGQGCPDCQQANLQRREDRRRARAERARALQERNSR